MSKINYEEEEWPLSLFKVCLGVLIFYLSIVIRFRDNWFLDLGWERLVFLGFGLISSAIVTGNIESRRKFAEFIGNWLALSGLYSVVLLPISGIGAVEYVCVCVILISDSIWSIISNALKSDIKKSDPIIMCGFCAVLLIAKYVVFSLVPSYLWTDIADGNSGFAFRVILTVSAVILILYLGSMIFKGTRIIQTIGNGVGSVCKSGKKAVRRAAGAIVSAGGPVAGLVVSCVILAAMIVFCFVAAYEIEEFSKSIVDLVGVFAGRILTTGSDLEIGGLFMNARRIVIFVGSVIYVLWLEWDKE